MGFPAYEKIRVLHPADKAIIDSLSGLYDDVDNAASSIRDISLTMAAAEKVDGCDHSYTEYLVNDYERKLSDIQKNIAELIAKIAEQTDGYSCTNKG
jgi:lysyl-tRNA synthetase class I